MLAAILIMLGSASLSNDPDILPPLPSDDAVLQALHRQRPGSEVISYRSGSYATGGKRICGDMRFENRIEPFAILVKEGERNQVVVTLPGEASPAGPPPLLARHWRISLTAPFGLQNQSQARRNLLIQRDQSARQTAALFCQGL